MSITQLEAFGYCLREIYNTSWQNFHWQLRFLDQSLISSGRTQFSGNGPIKFTNFALYMSGQIIAMNISFGAQINEKRLNYYQQRKISKK